MTFKVYKSTLPEDFEVRVIKLCDALRNWQFDLSGKPPPTDPEVERAVRRCRMGDGEPDSFVPDYEIVEG